MKRNPPRSPFLKGGSRTECARFRDQARARATTEPPDGEYYLDERIGWRVWVAGIAATLDRLHARGRGGERISWVLLDAFRAFLPLVDPGWWRAHPPSRPNAARRRRLREVHKTRRRVLRHGWRDTPTGEMVLWVCDATEAYLWGGDSVGVDRCERLINAMKGCPESESADLRTAAPGGTWGTSPPTIGPAFHHGGRGETSRRHDTGSGDSTGPGKEVDV